MVASVRDPVDRLIAGGGEMRRALAWFVGGLVVATVVTAIVFVAGMRAKSPPVLNAVRRMGRATKPLVLGSAGTPGAYASVVRHTGRTSGRTYETPVVAQATEDGFVIALPYGPNTDWLKNVLASGSATIVDEGATHDVDQPEMADMEAVGHLFAPQEQRAHRLFQVNDVLVVRRAAP
jgi:deazaflavin-dependent oxidoreductase (nitroreductase family)